MDGFIDKKCLISSDPISFQLSMKLSPKPPADFTEGNFPEARRGENALLFPIPLTIGNPS